MRQTHSFEKLELRLIVLSVIMGAASSPVELFAAGDVSAVQSGGSVIINGDADDNDIFVTNDGAAGTIAVSETGGGTVNGGGPATFAGVSNVVIRGRAGDDDVVVDAINITGNLTVQLYDGAVAQSAIVNSSIVGGNLLLSGAGTGDVTAIVDSSIVGTTRIVGGSGDDTGVVDSSIIEGNLTLQMARGGGGQTTVVDSSIIEGNMAFSSTGDADTTVVVDSSIIDGAAQIVTGNGEDTVVVDMSDVGGDLIVNLNHGNNTGVVSDTSVGGRLVALDGAHHLTFVVDTVAIGSTLNIDAGSRGDSTVVVDTVDINGECWVRTGDGEDTVVFDNIGVDLRTVVALRASDDVLVISDSDFGGTFQASGGPEDVEDVAVDGGGNTFAFAPIFTEFEVI